MYLNQYKKKQVMTISTEQIQYSGFVLTKINTKFAVDFV